MIILLKLSSRFVYLIHLKSFQVLESKFLHTYLLKITVIKIKLYKLKTFY